MGVVDQQLTPSRNDVRLGRSTNQCKQTKRLFQAWCSATPKKLDWSQDSDQWTRHWSGGTTFNLDNLHGATTHLTPGQVDDLVEFVLSLWTRREAGFHTGTRPQTAVKTKFQFA